MPNAPVDIDNVFTYHPPFGDQQARYEDIRENGKNMANIINVHCPATSIEKAAAIAHLRMAIMWANAAIACNEFPTEQEKNEVPSEHMGTSMKFPTELEKDE